MALPYEKGHTALEARNAPLLESLERIGIDSVEETPADPANTDSPLLFHLERGFGATEPRTPRRSTRASSSCARPASAARPRRSRSRWRACSPSGCEPEQIAIVVRDPARRGPLIASILESYGIPTALEAEIPASTTSVGGSLIALLEAVLGAGRATDLLRYLRGPSGISPGRVDWFERKLRRDRVQTAAAALLLWEEQVRRAARGRRPAARGGRPAGGAGRGGRGPRGGDGSPGRLGAGGACRGGDRDRDDRAGRARRPGAAARIDRADAGRDTGAGVERAGRGPGQDRRPPPGASGALRQRLRRLPAGRRVPARRPPTPTRSSPSASASRWACSRATTTTPRSATCSTSAWRCPNGGSSSPTATATRTAPPRRPRPSSRTSGRCWSRARARLRGRGLAEVVHRLADAPSETELARAIAARGRGRRPGPAARGRRRRR